MKNTMILLILISIGLTTPALAMEHDGAQHHRTDHRRVEQAERNQHIYARHDRRDEKYGNFQKRMKDLRKQLHHERRDNRRLERHGTRQIKRIAYDSDHRQFRQQYRVPVVLIPRPAVPRPFFPSVVLRIPLIW